MYIYIYIYIWCIYIYIYDVYIYIYIYIYIIVLFAMLRTLFSYLPFSVRYGKKRFFSIVGKSFGSVVQLIVRNFLIFEIFYNMVTLQLYLTLSSICDKLCLLGCNILSNSFRKNLISWNIHKTISIFCFTYL